MRWITSTAVSHTYGTKAEKSVMRFADMFASDRMGDFVGIFKNIAQAAQRKYKFSWAESADHDQQVKGNIVGVLGSQFKPLKGKESYMPLSTSMNLAYDIDALCDVKPTDGTTVAGYKKLISQFLATWKTVATPTEKWSSEQSAELANTIRKIRIQCEHTVEQGGAKEVIDRIERFQAKLCYIEAGIFAVSDIEQYPEGYRSGARKQPPCYNIIKQGFYEACQPPVSGDLGDEAIAREMTHDILIQGLFDREETLFATLGCQPLTAIRAPVLDQTASAVLDQLTKRSSRKARYLDAIQSASDRYQELLTAHGPEVALNHTGRSVSAEETKDENIQSVVFMEADDDHVREETAKVSPESKKNSDEKRNPKTVLKRLYLFLRSITQAASNYLGRIFRR